jgi:hypothetical protein
MEGLCLLLLISNQQRHFKNMNKEARSGRVLRGFSGAVNMDIRGEFSSGRARQAGNSWVAGDFLSGRQIFKTG